MNNLTPRRNGITLFAFRGQTTVESCAFPSMTQPFLHLSLCLTSASGGCRPGTTPAQVGVSLHSIPYTVLSSALQLHSVIRSSAGPARVASFATFSWGPSVPSRIGGAYATSRAHSGTAIALCEAPFVATVRFYAPRRACAAMHVVSVVSSSTSDHIRTSNHTRSSHHGEAAGSHERATDKAQDATLLVIAHPTGPRLR